MSLEDYRAMMDRCSNCLNCKWIPFDKIKSQRFGENCPSVSFYDFNTYSARGRFQLSKSLLDGSADYSDMVVEAIHSCNACGSCDISCKLCRYNLEPLEHNLALKAEAVKHGHILPAQRPILENLEKENCMIPGGKKSDRLNWLTPLRLKDLFREKAEAAFFAGCKYSYDKSFRKIANSAVQILLHAGADLGTLGNGDSCCAGRAFQMGFTEEFDRHANANIKALKTAGVKTIVTPCSDCYYTFKRLYAAKGLDLEVLHVVEYIERLLNEGKIKFETAIPMTVTYHDPCHLGRLGEPYIPWDGKEKKILNQIHTWEPRRPRYIGAYGVYDAPRNILNRIPGIKLVEMERIREYSWCCGAGGGCSVSNPEFSAFTANERMTEAVSTGAHAIVTACSWCRDNFMKSISEDGRTLDVVDIIDLVASAMSMEG